VGWADIIFCMEQKHADRIREHFSTKLADKPLIILRIPDNYPLMDPCSSICFVRNSASISSCSAR